MHLPYSQLVVTADFDPQLPSRVLGRSATANQLPERFELTRIGEDTCGSRSASSASTAEQARRLALKLQTMPSVREVELTAYGVRSGTSPARLEQAWL